MKTHNLTQSSLRNDPINCRMHGFSFCIFEDEIEVQDVISLLSLDQIPISSAPWMRKCIKNAMKSNGTRMGVWTVWISRRFRGTFFRREEHVFKGQIWARSSDEEAPLDRRSWSRVVWSKRCDYVASVRSMIKDQDASMLCTLKGCVTWWSVESSSCGHDMSRIPPIVSDLNHYNSRSTAEIISLIPIWSTCGDWYRVDLVSTASTRDIIHEFYLTLYVTPRVLQSWKQREHSPTRKKLLELTRLKCRADVTVILNLNYQMLICSITLILWIYINSTCHIRATQALAGLRGAAMWPCAPRRIHMCSSEYMHPFLHFF